MEIYLRPLEEKDALVSYKWRNNPNVWKFTGTKPDKLITLEIESDWIKTVLSRTNEKRFAICIKNNDEYIGNIQLTNIENNSAEFHIFIGDEKYWGLNIGYNATKTMLDICFNEIMLKEVFLTVLKENKSAVRLYLKCGFSIKSETEDQLFMTVNSNFL